jgi:hypothetical protein
MVDRWFRQEFCCEFTGTEGSVFDRDLVKNALVYDVKPLWDRR